MKKITTNRKANRRPARERKDPSGAQNQLSKHRSNSTSKKSTEILTMDTTLEPQINEEAVAEAPKQRAEFSRGQLGKAKRAFAKAGQPDASEEVRKKWLAEMSTAGIAVLEYSSSRLAKVIKGELTVAQLRK